MTYHSELRKPSEILPRLHFEPVRLLLLHFVREYLSTYRLESGYLFFEAGLYYRISFRSLSLFSFVCTISCFRPVSGFSTFHMYTFYASVSSSIKEGEKFEPRDSAYAVGAAGIGPFSSRDKLVDIPVQSLVHRVLVFARRERC